MVRLDNLMKLMKKNKSQLPLVWTDAQSEELESASEREMKKIFQTTSFISDSVLAFIKSVT